MVKAVEVVMKADYTRSSLGIAEGCTFNRDSIYRALSQRLKVFFICYYPGSWLIVSSSLNHQHPGYSHTRFKKTASRARVIYFVACSEAR